MSMSHPPDFVPAPILACARTLRQQLHARSQSLSIIETACGGLLSSTFVSTPGASSVFLCGQVLYTPLARAAFGGWSAEDVVAYSGPGTQVVLRLARENRRVLGADWVLVESGIAGPGRKEEWENGQPGYVALAVVGPGVERAVEVRTGGTERVGNMWEFTRLALELLWECVEQTEEG
ncbi:hypothetical protein DACRYDRAFT_21506 [Dacryopinax primogenitus]|uniref:CinA C-terminal domain-containing protein n=1 Tax=Dacryopinax primogenitus (strain DJM 731) TaxID=1858805 RepID=M5FZ15_DACPD|nr:uncharacterized protein DACRYDRAFT_21506 [Dacryopinax primogenitus]EJU03286.1 hypothetical protein DACRYDRAFT_21506 [Dacryopinax primogenitus]